MGKLDQNLFFYLSSHNVPRLSFSLLALLLLPTGYLFRNLLFFFLLSTTYCSMAIGTRLLQKPRNRRNSSKTWKKHGRSWNWTKGKKIGSLRTLIGFTGHELSRVLEYRSRLGWYFKRISFLRQGWREDIMPLLILVFSLFYRFAKICSSSTLLTLVFDFCLMIPPVALPDMDSFPKVIIWPRVVYWDLDAFALLGWPLVRFLAAKKPFLLSPLQKERTVKLNKSYVGGKRERRKLTTFVEEREQNIARNESEAILPH